MDRTVAHEIVHAVMFATGTLKENMPQFFTEGIGDSVQSDDDDNSGQTLSMETLVNNPKTLADALSFAEGTGSKYAYPAGNMFMRFIAKQGLNTTQLVGNSSQSQLLTTKVASLSIPLTVFTVSEVQSPMLLRWSDIIGQLTLPV